VLCRVGREGGPSGVWVLRSRDEPGSF